MKALKTLKAAYDSAKVRAITAAVGALTAPSAFAITKTDLTQDTSGGKTASDVMTNIDDTAQGGATLLISLVSIGGFVVVAMSVLSGVFYSIQSLPPFWQTVSHLNPFFYMIDGFRYGFFGQSDTSPWLSLSIVGIAWLAVSFLAVHLLRTGYKIRN